MKPMICTTRSGIRSRWRPRSRSCGSVVAARVSEARTPMVPLTSSAMPATSPGSETVTPRTSVRGPWAMKGIRTAKTANGTSTTIRGSR